MKALVFRGREHVDYEEIKDPGIVSGTDCIIRVKMASICGSDLHVYHERECPDHGTVMGHEFVGEVVEKGRDVKKFNIGDMVLCPFTTNCGNCYYCKTGLTCRCIHGKLFGWVHNGQGLQGGQAEYVQVPLADSTLVLLDKVTPEEGLLMGDIFSTGYFCAESAGIQPENVQAVVGCGPVGLMTIIAAKSLGAERLYAFDSIPERLKMAGKFGAIPVDFTKEVPQEILKAATDGRGADVVMEAVGSPAAGKMAFDIVRPGGTISTVGVHTSQSFSFSPVEAYDKNLVFKTGRCPARHYMEQLMDKVALHEYPISDIITHKVPLNEGVNAYKIFDKKEDNCLKLVLEVN